MSDAVGEIDRRARELLAQASEKVAALEAAEAARRKAFEREIGPLKQRVSALQAMLAAPETHGGQAVLPLAPNGTASDHRWVHPGWREQAPPQPSPPPEWWAKKLRPLNQTEALLLIAAHQGGVLRIAEARNLLIAAKKITGKRENAYGHLLKLVRDSGRFEKIAKGAWRLLPEGAAAEPTADPERDDDGSGDPWGPQFHEARPHAPANQA